LEVYFKLCFNFYSIDEILLVLTMDSPRKLQCLMGLAVYFPASPMELGFVLGLSDGVVKIGNLPAFIGELINFDYVRGLTLNLENVISSISILGNDRVVEQGDLVERTFAELLIEIGFFLIGRIIDSAGNYLDE
jgi:F0F1-type ATP synthase alpha subunit